MSILITTSEADSSEIYVIYIYITYSVTGSSGLEGEMESDMVVALRHRDVPGDLTRSSTCNKTNATRSFVTLRLLNRRRRLLDVYENDFTF